MTDEKDGEDSRDKSERKPTRNANGRFTAGGPSANPNGRPRKVKESRLEMLSRLVNEPIIITERGVKRKVSADEGVRLVTRNKALNGDSRAQAEWFNRICPELERLERDNQVKEKESYEISTELRRKIEEMAARHEAQEAAKKKRDDEAAGRNDKP